MENLIKYSPEILILLFLFITFLQSGIDKIVDWKGNTGFLQEHFSKTFLKGSISILLGVIVVFEMAAAALSVTGIVEFINSGSSVYAIYGCIVSCLTLLMLLFGQRIAKDYAGALTITCYFIVAVFGVFLLR